MDLKILSPFFGSIDKRSTHIASLLHFQLLVFAPLRSSTLKAIKHIELEEQDAAMSTIASGSTDDDFIVRRDKASNQSVSLSTAGIRAVLYQLQALYMRTPIKLFRPSRFDYMVYVRELANKHDNINSKPYRFSTHSTLDMLHNVIKKEGWKFIPDQVLPPFIANSATGIILYGSYLTALDYYDKNRPILSNSKRQDYYYPPSDTWRAGFFAGAMQSLAAAPVDAIFTRLSMAEVMSGKHQNLWVFGWEKLKEIGFVGVFAGYGFLLIKESIGFAFYFSTFELVKTRGYSLTYRVISSYRRLRRSLSEKFSFFGSSKNQETDANLLRLEQTRLTKILKSSFILIAGASAAFSLLAVQYPITKVQKIHLSRLEALDVYSASLHVRQRRFFKIYYNSYVDTFQHCLAIKKKSKQTWFRLAYKGFARNALTTIPATSVGLLVFEIMRTRLSDNLEELNERF